MHHRLDCRAKVKSGSSTPVSLTTPHASQRSISIEARTIALLILAPFALFFMYSIIHEFRRYKNEGRAKYGLVHDEETGTTHVTGIGDEDGYDPTEFDPGDYNERESTDAADDDKA